MVPIRSWDVETTVHTSFKRKANPFDSRNWVVTHGVKGRGEAAVEYRFGHQRPGPGWFKPVLDGCALLIGQNIKFDLLHALQDAENLEAWMKYISNGGRIWDIQLAEYLLNGMDQSEHMLSLDEIAPRYGGDVKVDEVKLLWKAGVGTEDIEPALLSRYLIGDDTHPGDVGNTELVALAQIKRAHACGQLESIKLNMGALVCSIELERNGMYVDKPRGLELAAELAAKIVEARATLESFLPADLPFQFNWNSRFHKSALIFGGAVKYEGPEFMLNDGTWVSHPNDPQQAYAKRVERCAIAAVSRHALGIAEGDLLSIEQVQEGDIPVVRFASGKNKGEIKTRLRETDDLSKPKKRATEYRYNLKGYTKPEKKWESSEPGVYSTASDVIEELAVRDIPFLKAFTSLAAMTKDLGTYYITTDEEGVQKGMLTLVGEDGIIHHKINHTATVTGRFSSSDPSLQIIPKGNKSDVKTIFKSRFGGKIIQSDFSSLEVYVQAILTMCPQLIKDLLAGLDMHVQRLSASPMGEGKSYAELIKLCKGYKEADGTKVPPVKEWDYKRTSSKVFSFQRALT